MFDQLNYDLITKNITILFSSRQNWYLLFKFHYFIFSFFHFWNSIPQHKLSLRNIQLWHPTSDHKTKVRGKHHKTVWLTQLVWKITGGKPTFVNWLFLVTLVICGTILIHSSNCCGQELVIIGGWYFDLIVWITFLNITQD